ncbi:MAG: group 1 truncated hemoglobin [Hydrogenothermaceae bacterium]|nr:group 1 truncated hemoglobin [Hydrogenothermaceae bacterium]
MKKLALSVGLAVVLVSQSFSADKTLYEKLGGKQAIDAVVVELINKMMKDQQLGKYCKGFDKEKVERNRQLVASFICKATGGPCDYKGRDMKTAHEKLKISEKNWGRFVDLTKETLDQFKVPADVQKEFLAAVSPLKESIVSVK